MPVVEGDFQMFLLMGALTFPTLGDQDEDGKKLRDAYEALYGIDSNSTTFADDATARIKDLLHLYKFSDNFIKFIPDYDSLATPESLANLKAARDVSPGDDYGSGACLENFRALVASARASEPAPPPEASYDSSKVRQATKTPKSKRAAT